MITKCKYTCSGVAPVRACSSGVAPETSRNDQLRVSSQITVRELRNTVKVAVKDIKNTKSGAHDLVINYMC